jgi:hypothetical protein
MNLLWTVPPLLLALHFWRRWRAAQRLQFIRTQPFPRGLLARLLKKRPGLSGAQQQLVLRGLRQFFLAYASGGHRFVAMPSQVADDLWHEFILYTREYERFCQQAFGGFLHHTPAVVLTTQQRNNTGLRRVWWQCCKEENIDPRRPSRLPLLFALDAKLGVADGFHYRADCGPRRQGGPDGVYCGADFASSSFDGGTDGLGDGPGGDSGDAGGGGD